ncbi:MAG TPA: hypothetical protein VJ955_06710 [Desulfuromonadales bacterium]|nr:hypothetical protein [Desulfuromonadales bacterium]
MSGPDRISKRHPLVGVIGAGRATSQGLADAYEVGRLLAEAVRQALAALTY